jgi:hypothetical protein
MAGYPAEGFKPGQEVEYFSQSQEKWIPTKISVVHSDGTVEVECKPGARVGSDVVRAEGGGLQTIIPDAKPEQDGEKARLKPGQEVEYFSKSMGKYIPTKITVVHSDGTIEVACKEGARIGPDSVRPLHQDGSGLPALDGDMRAGLKEAFRKHDSDNTGYLSVDQLV